MGFSDDVLKIETSGPDKPELTLVDLPELYYPSSSEQNEQAIDNVQRLTGKHMKSSRSIILAVISARADYHIQKILNIAQSFDSKYERVLGIVTQQRVQMKKKLMYSSSRTKKSSCDLDVIYCATVRLRRAASPMTRGMLKKMSYLKIAFALWGISLPARLYLAWMISRFKKLQQNHRTSRRIGNV